VKNEFHARKTARDRKTTAAFRTSCDSERPARYFSSLPSPNRLRGFAFGRAPSRGAGHVVATAAVTFRYNRRARARPRIHVQRSARARLVTPTTKLRPAAKYLFIAAVVKPGPLPRRRGVCVLHARPPTVLPLLRDATPGGEKKERKKERNIYADTCIPFSRRAGPTEEGDAYYVRLAYYVARSALPADFVFVSITPAAHTPTRDRSLAVP